MFFILAIRKFFALGLMFCIIRLHPYTYGTYPAGHMPCGFAVSVITQPSSLLYTFHFIHMIGVILSFLTPTLTPGKNVQCKQYLI